MSEKHEELVRLFEEVKNNQKKIAVFLQDSPDPDAVGSAAGVHLIAEHIGVGLDIFYGGEISHPQNKVLVKSLQLELYKYDKYKGNESNYGLIVFCDVTSAHGKHMGNIGIKPDVVIDHHREKPDNSIKLVDIRPVGAASSIVTEYLRQLNILQKDNEHHGRVATALFWGIKTDTNEWLAETVSKIDEEAPGYLREYFNRDMNDLIRNYQIPDYIFECEAKAQVNKQIHSDCLVSGVEYLTPMQRDAIPFVADRQLRRPGISTVVVYAIVGDTLHVSLRTKDTKLDESAFLSNVFGAMDSGAKLGAGGAKVSLGVIAPDSKSLDSEKERFWQYISSWLTRRVFEFLSEGS